MKALSCCIAALTFSASEVHAQSLTPAQQTAVTRVVEGQQTRTHAPGIALIIRRNGAVVFARGFGVDGAGQPFTVNTRAYLGSLSKSFTALAVMQLVVAGLVHLDDPVVTYLPDFVLKDPRGARITVRHLLLQTSGLTDANLPDWSWPWPRSFAESTGRVQQVTSLASDPGARHAYHNANYMLLGDLVERVSGERFADHLQRSVFEPLGMHRARAVLWMDEAADGVPPGHIFLFGRPLAVHAPAFFIGGAGGVIASAADLSTWLEVFARGGRTEDGRQWFPPDVIGRMLQPETAGPYQYQYGWVVRQPHTRLIRHNGGLPTFTAHGAFAPDDSLSIAVVINATPANPAWSEIGEDITDGVVAILDGRTLTLPSSRGGLRVEQAFALFTALMLALTVWLSRRTRRWSEGRRLVGSRAALYRLWIRALLVPGLLLLLIVVGLPTAVSVVESWSWLWLWYYSPAITSCLWLLAICAGALVLRRGRSLFAP